MPKILDAAVKKMVAKGMDKNRAYAVATKVLQKAGDLKPGTRNATAKGTKRGNMTEKQRRATPVRGQRTKTNKGKKK